MKALRVIGDLLMWIGSAAIAVVLIAWAGVRLALEVMLVVALVAAIVIARRRARRRATPALSIHVVGVDLKQEVSAMPHDSVNQMPPFRLSSSHRRTKLENRNPRNANNERVTSVTWSTDNELELPLEAIPDSTVQQPDPAWVDPGDGSKAPLVDVLDPDDGLPLLLFSVHANTPLDSGSGTVTLRGAGMRDASIFIEYGDPALGEFLIEPSEAEE